MTIRSKGYVMKKRALVDEIREFGSGLERVGAADKQTMKGFDLLALPLVRELTPKEIRAIRDQTNVSQAVFAALLNTSVSTVQKWEIGEKRPSGPSLKLLNVLQRKGLRALS
jgi:putative transcriptional regulator